MAKDEAEERIGGTETRVIALDKGLSKISKEFTRLEAFLENIALAVKNIECKNMKGDINPTTVTSYLR